RLPCPSSRATFCSGDGGGGGHPDVEDLEAGEVHLLHHGGHGGELGGDVGGRPEAGGAAVDQLEAHHPGLVERHRLHRRSQAGGQGGGHGDGVGALHHRAGLGGGRAGGAVGQLDGGQPGGHGVGRHHIHHHPVGGHQRH